MYTVGQRAEAILRHGSSKRGYFDPELPTKAELDIMREKAEALGRTGGRLDGCLRRLKVLEERIGGLETEGKGAKGLSSLTGEFNHVRQKALKYLHHLIIHREAIGFRRHSNLEKMYRIPAKRRPVREEDVR